jgi:hypothetical protein
VIPFAGVPTAHCAPMRIISFGGRGVKKDERIVSCTFEELEQMRARGESKTD